MKTNRILAIVLTVVMIAGAIFIGLGGKPVSRDADLYLTDAIGAVSPRQRQEFLALQKDNFARLSVAIVHSTGRLSTEDYCAKLWENWRLGASDMLLLLVDGAQDYYFGYSPESDIGAVLNANYSMLLERYLEPDFAAGDYGAGIIAFSKGIRQVLNEGLSDPTINYPYYGDDYYYEESSAGSWMTVVVVMIVMILLISVLSASSIGRGRGRTYSSYGTRNVYRSRPIIVPRTRTVYRPRPTSYTPRPSRPRSSSFGGGGRSHSSFGGGGRSSSFGGGGRSGRMGGGGRR